MLSTVGRVTPCLTPCYLKMNAGFPTKNPPYYFE